jgi:hypothetical protein
MPAQDRSRKLFVRSVLAATTTLATLVGAQNLALMDSKPVAENFDNNAVLELTPIPTQNSNPINESITDSSVVSQNESVIETTIPILSVQPSITIFRQPGSPSNLANSTTDNTTASLNNNTVILPPSPVVLQAPEPVVIIEEPVVIIQQQPAQQQQAQQPAQQQSQQNSGSKKSKSGSSK